MRACCLPLAVLVLLSAQACSPEARRVRDGGDGADPGNKRLVVRAQPEPRAADTTLWPGRDPAPVERLAKGEIPPPTWPARSEAPAKAGDAPIKPTVPASESQQRTYEGGDQADPRRQTGTTE
jgi:hypothetical protein